MTPADALTLLQAKMEEHGLVSLGWTGTLDNAVRRFGACKYRKKRITLSRHLITINSDEETLDTILHEIAHALAFEEHGEDCGHDERWQAIAIRIGARPERTVDADEVSSVAGSHFLVHSETGEVFRSYYRQPPTRDLSETWIRGRRAETEGKLSIVTSRELARLKQEGGEEGPGSDVIRSFDQASVKELSPRLTAALTEVCDEFGLSVELERGRFTPEKFHCKFAISVPKEHAEDGDRAEFELHCHLFGLTAEHFGAELSIGSDTFTLCGFKPRNRKYPVIGRDAEGNRYKFPAAVLDQVRGDEG